MAVIPERPVRVKSPNGAIQSLSWPNARDLVRNAKWTFVRNEADVVQLVTKDVEKASFIQGNDPTKIDVDALVKTFQAADATVSIDEMSRDELLAYADRNGIAVDKRLSAARLAAEIKAAEAASADEGTETEE